MNITVNAAAIKDASQKLSNWGKWGKDDQIGTLNYVGADVAVKVMKEMLSQPKDVVDEFSKYVKFGE